MQSAVGFQYALDCKFAKESSSETVKIWQNYSHESVAPVFFWAHPVVCQATRVVDYVRLLLLRV